MWHSSAPSIHALQQRSCPNARYQTALQSFHIPVPTLNSEANDEFVISITCLFALLTHYYFRHSFSGGINLSKGVSSCQAIWLQEIGAMLDQGKSVVQQAPADLVQQMTLRKIHHM